MASVVEILFKAKDFVSDVVDDIADSFDGIGEGAQEAEETANESLGNFMDKANETMLAVASVVYVAKEAFVVLGEVYEQTVGKVLAIAGEVEELSRASGDAPENMSLLRLEAEKADVPFDDLYKAMQNLNKEGIAPTLENLVLLADEYVKIQDPIAQAQFLTENFGSAGDEIAPMLDAIAGGIETVQDAGLIFTSEDIQSVEDYEAALAELNLTWDNLTISIGKKAIPEITAALGFFQENTIDTFQYTTESIGLLDTALALLNNQLNEGGGVPNYAAGLLNLMGIIVNAPDMVVGLTDFINEFNGTLDKTPKVIEGVTQANGYLVRSILANSTSWRGFQQDMEAAGLSMGGMTEETYYAEKALRAVGLAAGNATDDFQELNDTGVRGVKAIALEMASLEEQLANANLELAVQVRTFREDIGGQLYDMLRNAGLEGKDLELAIETLDTTLGTAFGKEYALELAIDDLFQQLLTDPEGFAESFGAFESAFFPLQESAQESITQVMHLQSQLDALVGEYNATINITTNGSIPNIGGGGGGGGDVSIPGLWASGGIVNAASGLAASLPHYWVGELGPEPFFPATDGRIVSNTQAMAALRGGANANARDIANAVREGVKEAMRETNGGNVYNLTMPTSSNPADVRTAFELMEAWGA